MLTFGIPYDAANDVLQQITSLDGFTSDLNPVHGVTYGGSITITALTPPFNSSDTSGTVLAGLDSGSTGKFRYDNRVHVIYRLAPETGYTFKVSEDVPKAYFDIDDPTGTVNLKTRAKKVEYIEEYLSRIYTRTTVPLDLAATPTPIKRVELNDLYLDGNDLILDVFYPIKPAVIKVADINGGKVGNLPETPANTKSIPDYLVGVDPAANFSQKGKIEWTKSHVDDTEFTSTHSYKAKITLEPKPGYTFVGANFASLEEVLDHATTGIWGAAGSGAIHLADSKITVAPIVVGINQVLVPNSEDILVITLDFGPL
jgi:hypothetical protein